MHFIVIYAKISTYENSQLTHTQIFWSNNVAINRNEMEWGQSNWNTSNTLPTKAFTIIFISNVVIWGWWAKIFKLTIIIAFNHFAMHTIHMKDIGRQDMAFAFEFI